MALEQVTPEPASLSGVRRFVRRALEDAPEVDPDTAVLLANELATNVVLHGRTAYDVSVEVADSAVRVLVHDENPRLPVTLDPIGESSNGHGLHLVARGSSRWGVEKLPSGKTVWFEISRH